MPFLNYLMHLFELFNAYSELFNAFSELFNAFSEFFHAFSELSFLKLLSLKCSLGENCTVNVNVSYYIILLVIMLSTSTTFENFVKI